MLIEFDCNSLRISLFEENFPVENKASPIFNQAGTETRMKSSSEYSFFDTRLSNSIRAERQASAFPEIFDTMKYASDFLTAKGDFPIIFLSQMRSSVVTSAKFATYSSISSSGIDMIFPNMLAGSSRSDM